MRSIKSLLLGSALMASLGLAGCLTAAQITTLIEDVQAYTSKACSVIPDANAIASLFDSNSTIADIIASADVIGATICSAVASANPSPASLPHHFDARIPGNHMRLTPAPVTIPIQESNGTVVDVVVNFL